MTTNQSRNEGEGSTFFTWRRTAESILTHSPAPPLRIKISLSALWSDKASPASLLSVSTCSTTSIHSWKRKAPLFHSTSLGLPPPPSPSLVLFPPPSPYSIRWWQSGHYTIFILSAPPASPHTSALPSVLYYHPSPFAQLLWAILLWPQPINLLQLDNDL